MPTPMMEQYNRAKSDHPDSILFFRMGDFYEMFGEDAVTASKVLGIALTSRSKGEDALPMAGVPHHSADGYLRKLIRAGFRVAVCDQVQEASEAVGIVDRQVTRIISAGTLTDDSLLSASDNNFLCAVWPDAQSYGLSWVDLSTGKFYALEVGPKRAADELSRISPVECLLPEERAAQFPELEQMVAGEKGKTQIRPRADWLWDPDNSRRELLEHFETHSLEGFGVEFLDAGLRAAGCLLQYLNETQKTGLKHISRIEPFHPDEFLWIDKNTQRALELTQTIRSNDREGSLLSVLDESVTAAGARLMKNWLTAPLNKANAIHARLDAVQEFCGNDDLRDAIRSTLKNIADLERISSRVSTQRANARDLLALGNSLKLVPAIKGMLGNSSSALLCGIETALDPVEDLALLLTSALDDEPALGLKEGGLIRKGWNVELDELRGLHKSGKDWLLRYQENEIKNTGIPTLKLGYNKVFGFYIEVSQAQQKNVPPHYIRKQTLKNAERYITPELKEYEGKVLSAEEKANAMEYALFLELRAKADLETRRTLNTAGRLAELDVLLSWAQTAKLRRYVRPNLREDRKLIIKEGRHPVLERISGKEKFVPNDIDMDPEQCRTMIITGPNMAGKSTYIRQIALLTLMAQMGSFIPAASAEIGLVDRLFTRVGASDELSRGESTFMVEMNETANILNNATDKSLIILDEVGRGTSTFDGLSIAWAVTEYIHNRVAARTLFATHYHQLSDLSEIYPGVKNFNIAVREWKDKIVFLRKIVAGATDKSYGIHVARLAGIPRECVQRAREILDELDEENLNLLEKAQHQQKSKSGRLGKSAAAKNSPQMPTQLSLFGNKPDPVWEALRPKLQNLQIETLSPLEALNTLASLKSLMEKKGEE